MEYLTEKQMSLLCLSAISKGKRTKVPNILKILIWESIEKLNPFEKEIIERRFWENKNFYEIAVELNTASKKVRMTFEKALKKLRSIILDGLCLPRNIDLTAIDEPIAAYV